MNTPAQRRIVLFLVATLWGLLGLGCDINTEPVAPSWDTAVNVPLVDQLKTMDELVGEHGVLLTTEQTGLLGFQVDGIAESTSVGDNLDLDDFSGSFTDSLGEFDVRAPAAEATDFTLGTLWPPAVGLSGTTATVPPFGFADLVADLPDFGTFAAVTLSAGVLSVTLTNNTPVPIQLDALELVDQTTGGTVVSVAFPSAVDPGQAATETADLAGAVFSNRMRVRIGGSSPGSSGDVLIDAGSSLTVGAAMTGLRASAATAQIPAVQFSFEDALDLPPDMVVESATLAQGILTLQVTSEIPLVTHMTLTFPALAAPGGGPLTLEVNVPADGTSNRVVDVAGYQLTPPAPVGGVQELVVNAEISTDDTGSEPVTVTYEDEIHLNASLTHILLDEVQGILSATSFSVPTTVTDVGLPEDLSELEGVALEEATLELVMHTTIEFPLELDLTVQGHDREGMLYTLPLSAEFPAAISPGERELRLVLDEDNSGLVDFINNLPEEVEIGGQVILGDGVASGSVRRTDTFRGEYTISTPLRLAFPSQTITLDPTRLDVEPQDDEGGQGLDEGDEDVNSISGDVTRYLKAGSIRATVANHLPFGMQAALKLGTDSATVFTNPQVVVGPFTVERGTVDPTSGLVEESRTSVSELGLSEEDLNIFKNTTGQAKRVYMGVELSLEGTGGQAVGVRATDFVEVSALAHLEMLMEPESW